MNGHLYSTVVRVSRSGKSNCKAFVCTWLAVLLLLHVPVRLETIKYYWGICEPLWLGYRDFFVQFKDFGVACAMRRRIG